MTVPGMWHSEIDERLGVPGDERAGLALACAIEATSSDEPHFESAAWRALATLDRRDGFETRLAVRAILRRPSDGRFLIFRYPFRDGSFRFVIPGGGAEPGEDVRTALRREVLEETGTEPGEDLRASGLLFYHLLASTIYGADRTPTIQYSPILTGTIADELPDTGGREAHWFSAEEFEAQPRRPISGPVLSILRASEHGTLDAPVAVWLPA